MAENKIDQKTKDTLKEKCLTFFKEKFGLDFNITENVTVTKVENLVAFCKDKTSKLIEKFEELVLVDGVTKVTIEPAIEPGAAIAMYAPDGTPIPAPADPKGYELPDGRIIMVEQDGVIASVKEKEVLNTEDKKDTPAATEGAPSVKEMIERIETVSRYQKESKEEFEAYKIEAEKKIAYLTEKLNETQKFTKESFEILLKEDAKTPITPVVNAFGQNKSGNIFTDN